ncbi:MAG: His/Gly/Thr/Pro-type tRNA ligase C-terminal domain-containing protein [Candidatus Saccharibacteria bacterium]|nr:His/Gly/Thr/Pro-type tRNA ligase C-terminal domain-containing protein [Candidatus Saccharibacteria bacterium]
MKYFILNQQRQVVEIDDYLKLPEIDSEFERFIRREALNEIIVEQSNDKPAYLAPASKLGFNWEQNADIGHVQYNFKANLMRRLVQDYARQLVHDIDLPIYEVNGANMFSLKHPVVDAYASLYGDRLYQFKSGKSDIVMSYDASYPQFNLAAKAPLSHKQLPFAHFSISDCYRQEQSGEMMLLLRQRRFYMPDIHPYFKDIAQAFEWFPKLQAKILQSAESANRKYQVVIEIPSEKVWQEYKDYIEQIPVSLGDDVLVNILEDGKDRYWAVNVDYKIIDKLGQAREIACIQVDIGNASRLNIHYIDEDGQAKHPVIIHSAIPGGIERYLYILFDNFEQGLPAWIQPVHIRLIPVGGEFVEPCKKLIEKYAHLPLRIEVDDRAVSVSSRLKSAHEDYVPHKIVVGQQEIDGQFGELDKLIAKLIKEVGDKPFISREWPAEVSRQL